MSAVVCQIPGCSTTQGEIEEELQTYLAGYCQACGKNREGRLCGCAFPCSLTFRGQMLMRIHEILAAPLPLAMKAIQVCYKHPELLKQARETCIALRDNVEESNTLNKPGDVNLLEKVVRNEGHGVLHALDGQGEDVTSIVYTDESGQEQSLVGQIVYTTGEDGEGNIIIQEVDAGQLVDSGGDSSSRIMKIQFGEDGGFVVAEGEERDEELEQRLEEELEGREAKLEQELEEEQGKSAMTRIQFSLASEERTEDIAQVEVKGSEQVDHPPLVDANDAITQVDNCSASSIIEGGVNVQQIQKELVGVGMDEEDFEGLSDEGGSVKLDDDDPNLLKIQYKEYQLQILSREMRPLLSRTCLCDIEIVCQDGRELTSGLVLGALSPMMKAVLEEVPRLDPFKTLMMPEISVHDFRVLNKLIFDEELLELTEAEERSIKRLSQTLGCINLLKITDKKKEAPLPVLKNPHPGCLENNLDENEEVLEKGIKRKVEEQENLQVKKGKLKHIKHTQSLENLSSSIRLEKSELNTDYIDESGLVRLSSADEMAMHYCLVCEGKFKKYNQAITHYDSAHNLLAALACDQCDDTFRDMFSCVKHKHAIHGEFDPNLQCYLCKEVMYSRFRLSTHIKDMHKSEYGEHVCRSCGMKFAAKHYLNIHQEESHNDLANSCSICGKTFSGKRYLTMHMKANHESNLGGGEDLTCQDCERIFPSSRDAAYHNSKVHGAPRPPGSFEDCEHCDKWFKTKGELSQHVSRIHSGVKNNKCTFCEAGFYKESDLKQHLNRHTGAKPFVCSQEDCEASFGFKTALTRHTKNKHGLKPPQEVNDLEDTGVFEISNINNYQTL